LKGPYTKAFMMEAWEGKRRGGNQNKGVGRMATNLRAR